MKFAKVPEALVERFDAWLPKRADVERRRMFGCPCAFVNGNMFTGLHESRLVVRLAERDRTRASADAGAEPFAVMGRAMREYVAFAHALERDSAELAAWMEEAYAYARSLPAKTKGERNTTRSRARSDGAGRAPRGRAAPKATRS